MGDNAIVDVQGHIAWCVPIEPNHDAVVLPGPEFIFRKTLPKEGLCWIDVVPVGEEHHVEFVATLSSLGADRREDGLHPLLRLIVIMGWAWNSLAIRNLKVGGCGDVYADLIDIGMPIADARDEAAHLGWREKEKVLCEAIPEFLNGSIRKSTLVRHNRYQIGILDAANDTEAMKPIHVLQAKTGAADCPNKKKFDRERRNLETFHPDSGENLVRQIRRGIQPYEPEYKESSNRPLDVLSRPRRGESCRN